MKEKITIKKQNIWKYYFSLILILAGVVLNIFDVGKEFLGFNSVGSWLIYIGFVIIAITTLRILFKKQRIVDERTQFIEMKASRITFVAIILLSFIVIIIDGIQRINIPYSYFMSYLICVIILIYFVSYKIFERKY